MQYVIDATTLQERIRLGKMYCTDNQHDLNPALIEKKAILIFEKWSNKLKQTIKKRLTKKSDKLDKSVSPNFEEEKRDHKPLHLDFSDEEEEEERTTTIVQCVDVVSGGIIQTPDVAVAESKPPYDSCESEEKIGGNASLIDLSQEDLVFDAKYVKNYNPVNLLDDDDHDQVLIEKDFIPVPSPLNYKELVS
jgi:hypothetical protein